MEETWTPLKVLEWTAGRFAASGIEGARLEAQVLLAHALGCDRVALYTQFDKPLSKDELGRFRELVRRRMRGEPVAYLTGEQEFWSLALAVDRRVLIPRRDSETVVEVVLAGIADRAAAIRILELATGSAAIALALARELPAAVVVASDLSADALAVAAANVARHGQGGRVELRQGDLYAPHAGERFDLVVANLPYVARAELAGLAAEVRHEPGLALDGGEGGLEVLCRAIAGAPAHLGPGGRLVLEHGFDQAAAVRELVAAAGFTAVATAKDLGGRDRVTSALRPR